MTMTGYVILVVLMTLVVVIYMELASLPGKTARRRGHPNAEAISTLAWLGLLLVVPWIIAMVWAKAQPMSLLIKQARLEPSTDGDPSADHQT